MRVQEKDPESCSNMTEEKSMNGGPHDVPSGSNRTQGSKEVPSLTATSEADRLTSIAGGRLKFFKDGKFILELSHHAEEGRGGAWLPVPKKTYWPPPGAAGTPRADGSTSLSVSDDNSSVQSSPWQRDHCWKQASPVRCRGQALSFMMRAPPSVRRLRASAAARRKRRRPLDPGVPAPLPNTCVPASTSRPRRPLAAVVRTLTERCAAAAARADPAVVSPRKRILREMERVSLEDLANSKRQRARATNGAVCKYSITSLLAEGPAAAAATTTTMEPSFLRTLLRSPPPPRPLPPSMAVPFLAPPTLFSAPAYVPASPVAPAASYYPPAWMPYPLSSLPPAWGAPMPVARSDEPCADVPLNLSKHAG